jgi:hypothetical protein
MRGMIIAGENPEMRLNLDFTGQMEDTRSWDWIPEIGGGVLSCREVTMLGREVEEGWVKVVGKVFLGFNKYLKGDNADITLSGDEWELVIPSLTELVFVLGC